MENEAKRIFILFNKFYITCSIYERKLDSSLIGKRSFTDYEGMLNYIEKKHIKLTDQEKFFGNKKTNNYLNYRKLYENNFIVSKSKFKKDELVYIILRFNKDNILKYKRIQSNKYFSSKYKTNNRFDDFSVVGVLTEKCFNDNVRKNNIVELTESLHMNKYYLYKNNNEEYEVYNCKLKDSNKLFIGIFNSMEEVEEYKKSFNQILDDFLTLL